MMPHKITKWFLYLNAIGFGIVGIAYTVTPSVFSQLLTGTVPNTASGLIDMRALAGGLNLAIGLLLKISAAKSKYHRAGLLSVLLILTMMATTRVLGIIIDGNPNLVMYIYLDFELFGAVCALALLNIGKKKSIK